MSDPLISAEEFKQRPSVRTFSVRGHSISLRKAFPWYLPVWFCSPRGIIYARFYVALFNYAYFKNASVLPIYIQRALPLDGSEAKYPSHTSGDES